ncbi:MAG: hypothetical protein QE271_02230 [Bacteriovoracaceae bacterium]|nr:hypothetical protein [Bacteriovoracaceae bacterium]
MKKIGLSLTVLLLSQMSFASNKMQINLNQGSDYAAPTDQVELLRSNDTPKNVWVNLTTSRTKMEKIKHDGTVERTFRSDLCADEFKTELSEEGKAKGQEIAPRMKSVCINVVSQGPCVKQTVYYFSIQCKSSTCEDNNRKRLVCYNNIKQKVKIKFKNMPKLAEGKSQKFSLLSYSDPDSKKVRFTLGADDISNYNIKYRNKHFIVVKYVGPKSNSNNDKKETKEDLAREDKQDALVDSEHENKALAEITKPGQCTSCGTDCLAIDVEKFLSAEKYSSR